MVNFNSLALAATTLFGLTAAAPAATAARDTATYVPGTLNNTREFYIKMETIAGSTKYNGYTMEAYHTGAGFADPVFTSSTSTAARAYLNSTHLQLDITAYPYGVNGGEGGIGDTNYARWEQISIGSGYGSGSWGINWTEGIVIEGETFGGWLVCEWYHGIDAPQLFAYVTGYDTDPNVFPSSCSRAKLVPEYI